MVQKIYIFSSTILRESTWNNIITNSATEVAQSVTLQIITPENEQTCDSQIWTYPLYPTWNSYGTKEQRKGRADKKKKGTNSTATNAHARAKNSNNNRKRQASDSDESSNSSSDSSSDDAPVHPKRKPRKKKAKIHEDIPPNIVPEQVDGEAYQSSVEDGGNDKVSRYIYSLKTVVDLPVIQSDDENDDENDNPIPQEFNVKKESTKDLLTVFSDLVTVKFKRNGEGMDLETVRGRWCLVCKYVTQNGLRLVSGNDTDLNAEAMTRPWN